jgi:hypothetical protein
MCWYVIISTATSVLMTFFFEFCLSHFNTHVHLINGVVLEDVKASTDEDSTLLVSVTHLSRRGKSAEPYIK